MGERSQFCIHSHSNMTEKTNICANVIDKFSNGSIDLNSESISAIREAIRHLASLNRGGDLDHYLIKACEQILECSKNEKKLNNQKILGRQISNQECLKNQEEKTT